MKVSSSDSTLSLSLWRRYVIFSLAVSVMIMFVDIARYNFEAISFFPSLFVLINYFYYMNIKEYDESMNANILFSTQIIALVGMGFEYNYLAPFFVTVVPVSFGILYCLLNFQMLRRHCDNYTRRAVLPFIVLFCSYLAGYGITKVTPMVLVELSLWMFFLLWAGAISYYGGKEVQDRHYPKFGGQRSLGENGLSEVSVDRMFFHDIINSTHGMSLFLSNRINSGSGVSAKECKRIDEEIKLIQIMLKDYFGMNHRNLEKVEQMVPLVSVAERLIGYVRNYLPESEVNCKMTFNGMVAPGGIEFIPLNVMVDYPSLYRIIVNLVKNIKEEGSKDIMFDISVDGGWLRLKTMNKIFKLSSDGENMIDNLKDMITGKVGVDYKSKKLERGVGLESIFSICAACGGKFDFCLEDGHWANRVDLPIKIVDDSVHDKNEHKKAA